MFEISEEQKKELLKYLAKRPYIEVAGLVAMIAGQKRQRKRQGPIMQRRNFKDAMREMSEHTVAKIGEHVETLARLDKEQKGELLKFGSIEMDTDFPRTVLYAILNRVVHDFVPRNDEHKDTMDKVLKTLETKELIKRVVDESGKK